jgi:hypothetical protein
VRQHAEPNDPRPAKASRVRIWSPFVIGSLGGTVAILFEAQIGEFLGVYSGLLGYLVADLYAGAVIGFFAGLASRTWTGLLTLVLGLVSAGAAVGVFAIVTGGVAPGNLVSIALYLAFLLGLFGVPAYAVITGISYLIRWIPRAARPPEGPA